jgi:dihydropteroate synthase
VNVTPDSFSGDGIFHSEKVLLQQLETFAKNGVSILDVGAESTRPNAVPVTTAEELERLQWAFKIISEFGARFRISLDCRHADVVKRISETNQVDFLNDVTGFSTSEMTGVLKNSDAKAFVMHSLGVPPTKEKVLAEETDPCEQLISWWGKKIESLESNGVDRARLIFDPGIGFGKTPAQNLYILKTLQAFSAVKNEIMIGHSRKSFQTVFSDRKSSERDLETALVSQNLNTAYVQYLRVHDPVSQRLALIARGFLC